jgi:pullulanase/glycogen debranching enzyme
VLPVRKQHPAGIAGPRHHWHELVIYELHVKGFTARANSGVTPEKRGTFLGIIATDSVFAGSSA